MKKKVATWWSGRLVRSLEKLGLVGTLNRGREYLKKGRLKHLRVDTLGVHAVVRDGDQELSCNICFEPFTDFEWEESLERLAFQDLAATALLSTGSLPPHIETFFTPSGRHLLPVHQDEVEFYCECGQGEGFCEHTAAAALVFAEQLELDPWLLFVVRGRTAAQVQQTLEEWWDRERPQGVEVVAVGSDEEPEAVSDSIDAFWRGLPLEESLLELSPAQPGVTAERMGLPQPSIEAKAWQSLLVDMFATVSKRAKKTLSE